jgi:antitoxin component HigA of HigAB toxin-antitoxin module
VSTRSRKGFLVEVYDPRQLQQGEVEERTMKTMNKANPFANGIPKTYKALCKRYLPRKIHDDAEDREATAIVDALAGHDLKQDQEDYLDLVSDLVDEYDRATRRQPKEASPIDVLKLLLEQHKFSARGLSRVLGKDESLGL